MKKILSCLFAFSVLVSVLNLPAFALSEETEIEAIVESYLRSYSEKSFLYADQDLKENTVAEIPVLLSTEATNTIYQLSSGSTTIYEMQDNIGYLNEKAEYFSAARQLQNIKRENFELFYAFSDISVDENTATVNVLETASFTYIDGTMDSYLDTLYTVDLLKIGGKWLIADVTDNDWFDATYKDEPSFSAADEIAVLESALHAEAECVVIDPVIDNAEVTATGSYQIPYNAENAVAYAYNHTRQNAASWKTYYNPDFYHWRNDGDCMNFASQCVWAGFSGNLTRSSLDAHNQPMDTDSTYKWYTCSQNYEDEYPYSEGYSNSYASWRSCKNFRRYLTGKEDGTGTTGSNAATDVGMKATVVEVGSGSTFSGITAVQLKGAVAHVDGTAGNYAHAIVITEANGLARSQIYYSAHTGDAKYIKLGDSWTTCPIKAYIPQYFRTNESLSDYIQYDMIRPFACNSTKTISFSTNAAQYNMRMYITTPVSNQRSLIKDVSYGTDCSASYTFTEQGYYKVECYSRATSADTYNTSTFYILSV